MDTRPHPEFPDPQIERVSMRSMMASLLAILNLERGIFYTSREMIKSPGEAMRRYLFVDRSKFIEPLKFLVLTIPIYLFLTLNFFPEGSFFDGFEEGLRRSGDQQTSSEASARLAKVTEYIVNYSDLLLLLTVPISAFWTRILFSSYRLNYGEHLVLNAFLYGFMTLAYIAMLPLHFFSATFAGYVLMLAGFAYQTYFLQSFFQKGWVKSLLYSAVLLTLSMIVSMIGFIIIIVGLAIIVLN